MTTVIRTVVKLDSGVDIPPDASMFVAKMSHTAMNLTSIEVPWHVKNFDIQAILIAGMELFPCAVECEAFHKNPSIMGIPIPQGVIIAFKVKNRSLDAAARFLADVHAEVTR